MEPKELVTYLVRKCRAASVSLGQTRTTKLLYLIEWEYYRYHQSRLTDLTWLYFHYGPWSPELSRLLQKDFAMPDEPSEPSEGALQFRPVWERRSEFGDQPVVPPIDLRLTVDTIIGRFASMQMPDLLDFVYFHTEPMRAARERRIQLDFSTIPSAREAGIVQMPRLTPAHKRKFQQLFSRIQGRDKSESVAILPDETDLRRALESSDRTADIDLRGGTLLLSDEDRERLKSISGDV